VKLLEVVVTTPTMTNTSTTENSAIEARVFHFLARLWIAEPDETVLRGLNEDATRSLWHSLGGFVPEGEPSAIVEQLGYEYCACFLGPKGHLPPHQSVVEQSHFQGECLSSMNRFIEVIGMPENALFESCKSMPDHIGIQLALMGRICDTHVESNDDVRAEIGELRIAFFQHHLSWIKRYCSVAKDRTSSDFYRGLFAVTMAFLTDADIDPAD
jgi:TorA maturation chaperone TorD